MVAKFPASRCSRPPHLEIPDLEMALHRPQAEPAGGERGGVAKGKDQFVVAPVLGDAVPCDEAEAVGVVGTKEEARRRKVVLRAQGRASVPS